MISLYLSRTARLFLPFCLLAFISACDQAENVTADVGEISSSAFSLSIPVNLATDLYPKGIDYQFARIAQQINGFGGMYIEEGSLIVLLTNPQEQEDALRATLASVYPEGSDFYEEVIGGAFEVRQAPRDFTELATWKVMLHQLFSVAGVTSVGIDHLNSVMNVRVEDQASRAKVEYALSNAGFNLDNVDIEIVSTDFSAERTARVATRLETRSGGNQLNQTVRPIRGGLEGAIENGGGVNGVGTISTIVKGRVIIGGAAYSKYRYLITSHQTRTIGDVNFSDPDEFYQSNASSQVAGVERSDPPFSSTLCPSGTPSGTICRRSDTALIDVDDDLFYDIDYGGIYRTTGRNTTSITIPSSGLRYFTIDDGSQRPNTPLILAPRGDMIGYPISLPVQINKRALAPTYEYVGKVTGWQSGPKGKACFTFNMTNAFQTPGNDTYLLTCQSEIFGANPMQGDSGAPVFKLTGSFGVNYERVVFIGTLIGKITLDTGTTTGVYSKWSAIVDDHEPEVGVISVQD